METDRKSKKLLTPKRIRTFVIIIILAAVIALGFIHQRYLRSDRRIKDIWNKNSGIFVTAADGITENGVTFGKRSVNSCKDHIIGMDDTFDKLSELGISYISYNGHDIDFYSEYDHYYIFHTDNESIDKEYETELSGSWGYLKTRKK